MWALPLGYEENEPMNWRSASSLLQKTVASLIDLIPPYRVIEGPLRRKEMGLDGSLYLVVGDQKVEVDSRTFEILIQGERLKVRSTRRLRAITIERLSSGQAPG